MVIYAKAVDHPRCPELGSYVRIQQYQSKMVIEPHTTFDEVRILLKSILEIICLTKILLFKKEEKSCKHIKIWEYKEDLPENVGCDFSIEKLDVFV